MTINHSSINHAPLEVFQESIEIPRFKTNLRSVLFEYLSAKHYDLIPDFERFMQDMNALFDLLDALEHEKEADSV
ncbi:hypothetical protein GCM10009122_17230 [Fulvivirga kasyanovii]|uniref:Uncharacterized protein n=1 Tax=Fulvivirga kasyanovii TaxID=396812 RepID=A0ABW9RQP5_9BACT|nr:hypothetical protein [Fulvivirga kasyanovii]MTI26483.1 hypothetical protein [Fulvivirga kasyanovii]